MTSRRYILAGGLVLVALLVALLFAGVLPAGQATMALSLRDPPPQAYSTDVQSINVTLTEIDVHMVNATGDSWITLTSNQPVTIDLLSIINTTQSLGNFKVAAGNYTEIRFMVSSATAVTMHYILPIRKPFMEFVEMLDYWEKRPFMIADAGSMLIAKATGACKKFDL